MRFSGEVCKEAYSIYEGSETAQDMYPVQGMERDICPIKIIRPAYINWRIKTIIQ
jgi:hypothetical protein